VKTADFSLEGRPIRKVRQSGAPARDGRLRGARAAAERDRRSAAGAARADRRCLARGGARARFRDGARCALRDRRRRRALLRRRRRKPAGRRASCTSRSRMPARLLSLSTMPRFATSERVQRVAHLRLDRVGAPQWLCARVTQLFAIRGAAGAGRRAHSRQRVQAATLRALKGHFQLDNLLLFNRKFFPGWEPRFVAYERRRDLPRVGVAALSAEAYLPRRDRPRARARGRLGSCDQRRLQAPACRSRGAAAACASAPAPIALVTLPKQTLVDRVLRRDRRLGAVRRRVEDRAALARAGRRRGWHRVLALGSARLSAAERIGVGAALGGCFSSPSRSAATPTPARSCVGRGGVDGCVHARGGSRREDSPGRRRARDRRGGHVRSRRRGDEGGRWRRRPALVRPGAAACHGWRSCACSLRSSAAAGSRRQASPCSGRMHCPSSPARFFSARASGRLARCGPDRRVRARARRRGRAESSRRRRPFDALEEAGRLSID